MRPDKHQEKAVSSSASSLRTSSVVASHLKTSILYILAAYVFFAGQSYITSTFVGKRPLRGYAARPSSRADLWSDCAEIVSSGLANIGDASPIWLKSAFVGTNTKIEKSDSVVPHPSLSSNRYKCRCLIPQVYAGRQPRLSAIIQSFNHRSNIANISTSLKSAKYVDEIIVSEDGSTDGSMEAWSKALPGPGHFVIRSNNLHELRSYNRAMRMSAGDVVVLLQDDDLLPPNDIWIKNAFRLFKEIPDLGVLGGYIGQLWDPQTGHGFEYGEQVSTHGGLRNGNTEAIAYVEPKSGLPFMFAECVWIAPVFVRRSLLRKAGGLELAIAKRGEPGVWQDCVFSYEAWVNGYSVGVFSAPFERGVGGHGSATSDEKVKQRERVWERAVAFANRKFSRKKIHEYVIKKNSRTLNPRHTGDIANS